jgi:phosphohistidine phosphatase SixA
MNIKSLSLLMVWLLPSVGLQATELSDKLQSPDHVVLMRHSLAPGIGDPANYALDNCSTQRNLSEEGKNQARLAGNWLRKQGVFHAKVYSSVWCRCQETAKLLDFDGHQVAPALASFFNEINVANKRNLELQKFIAHLIKTKGTNALILVTHHVNIYQYVGENVASGEMIVAKVDKEGRVLSYQLISRND